MNDLTYIKCTIENLSIYIFYRLHTHVPHTRNSTILHVIANHMTVRACIRDHQNMPPPPTPSKLNPNVMYVNTRNYYVYTYV